MKFIFSSVANRLPEIMSDTYPIQTFFSNKLRRVTSTNLFWWISLEFPNVQTDYEIYDNPSNIERKFNGNTVPMITFAFKYPFVMSILWDTDSPDGPGHTFFTCE